MFSAASGKALLANIDLFFKAITFAWFSVREMMDLSARKDNKRRVRFKIFTCYLSNLHAAILTLMYQGFAELVFWFGCVDVEVAIVASDPALQTSSYKAAVESCVVCG